MNILTKRNGIALVAVMVVLLFLTLLLPIMFSMSDRALVSAMKGTDELRSSYLARTMVEMSVSAFEDCYDAAQEDKDIGNTGTGTDYYKMDQFMKVTKNIDVSTLYMYRNNDVAYPTNVGDKPVRSDYKTDKAYKDAYDAYIHATYSTYNDKGVIYTINLPTGVSDAKNLNPDQKYTVKVDVKGEEKPVEYNNCSYIGKADCKVVYDDATEYYEVTKNATTGAYNTEKMTNGNPQQTYEDYLENAQKKPDSLVGNSTQYFKIEKRNVTFESTAVVNGKLAKRRCILVLPTKPGEKSWLVPASFESNQIFPDTSKASSVKALSVDDSPFIDGSALEGQPVYIFSCIGNMVISSKDLKVDGVDYGTYIDNYNASITNPEDYIENQFEDLSFGVHPVTTTLNPANDPTFSCLKTNNMSTWASSSQRDNFVAFTASNGIQIDMPVNLLMNPCRTGRIGDGFDKNESLYKIMYFQAPTIVFNNTVNSFISLYHKGVVANIVDYNAYRMTSIILAAPQSTPYSYYHEDEKYKRTVKAGKVVFAEDAYIWLIPFTENGSNYKTQTVYYKGKDIIIYKFASAGDIFLFNTEVHSTATVNNKKETQRPGFSMTGYFMDVIYNRETTETNNTKWYEIWSGLQEWIYKGVQDSTSGQNAYVQGDLKYLGNMYEEESATPMIDDFYVIWES